MTRRWRLVTAILFGAVAVSFSQDGGLTLAEAAFVQAVADRERPALEKLLDADFWGITADGVALTKSALLRRLPKMVIAREKDGESRVFLYGDLADIQVNQRRFYGRYCAFGQSGPQAGNLWFIRKCCR